MLEEYLNRSPKTSNITWTTVMPGVHVCHFTLQPAPSGRILPYCAQSDPSHFETLFCTKGSFKFHKASGPTLEIKTRDILLLSASPSPCRISIGERTEGFLVTVDAANAKRSLQTLCSLMGNLKLNIQTVKQRMDRREGCVALCETSWNNAIFDALENIASAQQARYCVFKSVELLFLLCTHSNLFFVTEHKTHAHQQMDLVMKEMCTYMEQHLDEKLTIPHLSQRFCLSPTSLKENFRRIYGQPVHTWLQQKRVEHAASLLHSSAMSVLEVAQSVGYDGISQFNVIFKRQYGLTPTQYRKMSNSVKP